MWRSLVIPEPVYPTFPATAAARLMSRSASIFVTWALWWASRIWAASRPIGVRWASADGGPCGRGWRGWGGAVFAEASTGGGRVLRPRPPAVALGRAGALAGEVWCGWDGGGGTRAGWVRSWVSVKGRAAGGNPRAGGRCCI